jgi:hypothetical protein
MFENEKDARELEAALESWVQDSHGAKKAFTCLRDTLEGLDGAVMRFYPRPGISYSLRAALSAGEDKTGRLFALVDVVEDPSERWLSVCFYERMVTDPMESGETVPKGLLGEDGYCFHVTCYDEELMTYLKERILEAYSFSRDKRGN